MDLATSITSSLSGVLRPLPPATTHRSSEPPPLRPANANEATALASCGGKFNLNQRFITEKPSLVSFNSCDLETMSGRSKCFMTSISPPAGVLILRAMCFPFD